QFRTASPDPRFDVTAPNNNPLVASVPVSITQRNDVVALSWEQAANGGISASAEAVLEQLTDRAKKETRRFPNSVRAHANFGMALAKSGHLQEAIAELQIALAI